MKVNTAVVGTGDWGKNVLQKFATLPDSNLVACYDAERSRLEHVKSLYDSVRASGSMEELLADDSVQAVAIASPGELHFGMARRALLSGKHVFVEKPLALRVEEAEELVSLSREAGLKLMVGHLMLYHPVVRRLKEIVAGGGLGTVYYITSQRINLGKVRSNENALWSLAPHDISIILHLLEDIPCTVSAYGRSYLQDGVEDVVFLNLLFKNGCMAQVHTSWLDPHKIRKMTVVGSEKMAVFDDMESLEKLKIFDSKVDRVGITTSYGESLTLRYGDIHVPWVKMEEPLAVECQHFLDCILRDEEPFTGGENGLRVVRVLSRAQESLRLGGRPVEVS